MAPWIFNRDSVWSEISVKEPHNDFPTCSYGNYSAYTGTIIRALGDSLMMGPIENGPVAEGIMMPDHWRKFSECGVNFICADQVSPTLLSKGAVWSWAKDEPAYISKGSDDGCVYSSRGDGHWFSLDPQKCLSLEMPVACRSDASRLRWSVSAASYAGTDHAGRQSSCQIGFSPATPTSGRENALLRLALQQSNRTEGGAWLTWSAFPL